MKKWIALCVSFAGFAVLAQTSGDAARARISAERSKLEAIFVLEDTACYKKFLVNNCLNEVKVRRRDQLADLRRQEILLNDEARRTKAVEQLQKIEDKSSSEKLQQKAEKKSQALKHSTERTARDEQKNVDRITLQEGEKANAKASASRVKSNQDKQARIALQQATVNEELRKYNERQAQSKERQARYARDKASQTKSPAKPLPARP